MIQTMSRWLIVVVIVVATSIVIAGMGCIGEEKRNEDGANVTQIPQKTPEIIFNNDSQISSTTEKIMEKYSLNNLILMADSIVVGEVTGISSSKWNTPDGKKPTFGDNTSYIIYTDIEISAEDFLKNPQKTGVVFIRVLGGVVGEDAMEFEDQPSFNVNENVLIFLKEDEDPRTKNIGPKHFITAGLHQGKIPILKNGEVIVGDKKISINEIRIMIITSKDEI